MCGLARGHEAEAQGGGQHGGGARGPGLGDAILGIDPGYIQRPLHIIDGEGIVGFGQRALALGAELAH